MKIIEKLTMAEQLARQTVLLGNSRMEAIGSIKKLLEQIDFHSEVVPLENQDKLLSLLVSLKGKALDKNEKEIVNQLTSQN